MKAVILAGGLGTRISEETDKKPKPMVEIGGRPILWHIMKIFSTYGIKDFIICLGFKGYLIKEYFSNYFLHESDLNINLSSGSTKFYNRPEEDWNITLIDTGLNTLTGGRLRRVKKYLESEEDFCFTYGDGVADIDITKLISFHKSHSGLATVTAVTPPGRFGALVINNNKVESFSEKPFGQGGLINGGFFVLSTKCIDFIKDDQTTWEKEPLMNLAKQKELFPYLHNGFWHPMDTLRDKRYLEELWNRNEAKWKVWN